MINIYLYPALIIISLLFIFIGIYLSWGFAPKKIKVFSIILFFLLTLRYIILEIFIFRNNIIFLYVFKPLFFINYLCIPMVALVSIYITMRNEKIKFSGIFPLFLVFFLLYFIVIYILPCSIKLSENYGYNIYLINSSFIKLFDVLVNVFFLVIAVNLLYKKHLDIRGIYLIIVASLLSTIEAILPINSGEIFQQNLLSNFIWIITFVYALNKLKSRD